MRGFLQDDENDSEGSDDHDEDDDDDDEDDEDDDGDDNMSEVFSDSEGSDSEGDDVEVRSAAKAFRSDPQQPTSNRASLLETASMHLQPRLRC